MSLPGGPSLTLAVVPLAPVRLAWASHPEGMLGTVLTQAELAVSGMHRLPERRVAHLAGRVAAKSALLHHLAASGVRLVAQELGISQVMAGPEQGRPVVQVPPGTPACDVSISHSKDLAVAVATTGGRVGVDLEAVQPRGPGFHDEVFTDVEQDWLMHCQRHHGREPDELWSLGWCLKEALVKRTGHGLRDSLQQVGFTGWEEHGPLSAVIPGLTDAPGAFCVRITLNSTGPGRETLSGLLALGRGYALAVLHVPEARPA
ncbi:4'-phosphopantetheinyl transferase family protein [Corallococcus terminator]|uniref:4'-phosphopantetheinyl transferase family protein n=1 Tax=Corallococcus terminator TaxID=2316733 RepID=UPI001FC92ECF|nr:4'-phosphopantetheinyl transferase superfamily protein [Corallococcus terminator]